MLRCTCFEDNKAVIEMIIKGRSPTMRHVSRPHRVALDWLFDRINLDPKIQVRHIVTKNQLADILTNGNFTRDEWNNIPHLFDSSHFSSLSVVPRIFSLISCTEKMEKMMQEQSEENRIDCGEIQADGDDPGQFCSYKFFICEQSDCVEMPGVLKASSRQIGLSGTPDASTNQNSNPDAASSSQGWLRDALLDVSTGRPAAPGCQGYPENPQTPEDSEGSEPESRIWPLHFRISPDMLITRRKSSRSQERLMIGNRRMT